MGTISKALEKSQHSNGTGIKTTDIAPAGPLAKQHCKTDVDDLIGTRNRESVFSSEKWLATFSKELPAINSHGNTTCFPEEYHTKL